jgi:hypothetical protein
MIQGKVATVIPPYEVAFNVGSKAGVKHGDTAVVLKNIAITDPETGDLLGTVDRPAVRLRIIEVTDQLCVGETFISVSRPDDTAALGRSSRRRQRVTSYQSDENWLTVYVSLGQEVQIEHDDEPPF